MKDFSFAAAPDHQEFAFQSMTSGFNASMNLNLNLGSNKEQLFQTNSIPFYGREKELQVLEIAGERVCLEWMENPSEIIWLSGPAGIGKSTLLKHAAANSFWKAFVVKGACEQHRMASKPYKCLGDCLSELCFKLQTQGGKAVWKARLEEALGGEGPLLATIVPRLCPLMDIQPMDRRKLGAFDANTHLRFKRMLYAVKDFLQAISEYHPLVMIIDNLQWADLDSLQIIYELLASEILLNFLFIGAYDSDAAATTEENNALQVMREGISETTDIRTTDLELPPFQKEEVEEILCSVFLEDGGADDDAEIDKIQDLAEILFALSKGNTLWMMQLLRLLNDSKLITYDPNFFRWEWNRKKIKKEVKAWRENDDRAFDTMEGVIAKRLVKLPNKIKFVVQAMADFRLTFFKIERLFTVIAAAYTKESRKDEACPIKDQAELESFVNKACTQGIITKLNKKGFYKFSHDIVRECAYTTLHPKNEKGLLVHLRLGGELSALALPSQGEERERFKFGAVDQLNRHMDVIEIAQKSKLAKLNLEAAEIAMNKTAFRSAIEYLENGMTVLNFESRWQKEHYDVTLRTFLFLGRMRLCCGRLDSAKAACEEIVQSASSLKDKLYANQVLCFALQQEGKWDEALTRLTGILQKMGETFPKEKIAEIIDREINNLLKAIAQKKNQELLNPPRMTDKKSLDIMLLFAHLIEVCNVCKPEFIPELVMIRMMHLSLRWGFSRQYPLAFSLFAVALAKRGQMKESHRMGQVGEKLARLGDFYGGEAVCLFHWHVGHWRRTYKRSLEPVLEIYNAQVDSGDFHHVGFSITTYVQYHLASGFDLERLSDNLELFDGLFADYNLPDDWHILIPYQVVANLLGESLYPLLFFGDTVDQQETKVAEMEEAGMDAALDYYYFMRLYVAFFFHEYEIMEECLEVLRAPSEGVWVPWAVFFECYLLIQKVPSVKGGKKKRELKEQIDTKQDQIVDWYNQGNPNASAMASILEAEYVISNEAGKGLSALKVQGLYDEAIAAAAADGATHLEAFAAERAGLHFHSTGVEGFSAEYLAKAHKAYDTWNAVAKVIDIESKFADKLQISKRRQPIAASFIAQNKTMAPAGRKKIGGGPKEVKTINIIKTVKNAKKISKKGISKSKRKVRDIFKKKEQADPAPWGVHSNKIEMNDDGSVIPSSPVRPRSTLGGLGINSPGRVNDYERNGEDEKNSPSRMKSPFLSPKQSMSKLFGKKLPLGDGDEVDDVGTAENKGSEAEAKEKSSKKSKSRIKLPFGRKKKNKKREGEDDAED